MKHFGWLWLCVLALLFSAVPASSQQTEYEWGDLAGFQPARTCVQAGLTLGPDLTVDQQPRYDNLDLLDNGLFSYLLDGQKVELWVSVPGQSGYLQIFVDNNDIWLTPDEWYIQNLNVAEHAENGIVAVTVRLHYLPTDFLRLRLVLTDQPISAEQLAQFAWELGCGEVEDYILNLRAAKPVAPGSGTPPSVSAPPSGNGGTNPAPPDNGGDDDGDNNNPPPDNGDNNDQNPPGGGNGDDDHDNADHQHCNAGGGNGTEQDDDGKECDPGNSDEHNNADEDENGSNDDDDHDNGGQQDCNDGQGNGDEGCDAGKSEDNNHGGDEDTSNPGHGNDDHDSQNDQDHGHDDDNHGDDKDKDNKDDKDDKDDD